MAKQNHKRGILFIVICLIAAAVVCGLWVVRPMILRRQYPLAHQQQILDSAVEFELDPYWIAAVIRSESGFRSNVTSPVGAVGLMQIMPDTGQWISEKLKLTDYDETQLTDPGINIRMGCWYLSNLLERFGTQELALAAYNGGEGNVRKWQADPEYSDDGVTLKHIPFRETRLYIERVAEAYNYYVMLYKLETTGNEVTD